MNELLTSLGLSGDSASALLGAVTLESILGAALTLLICLIAIKVILDIFRKLLDKSSVDTQIRKYALSAIRFVLWLVTILIVADRLGIPISSLVALLSVLSLAVSLAVQSVLSNVAAGIVLMSSKPFRVGDFIETPNGIGTVHQLSLSYTYLDTPDGLRVVIPNSVLSTGKVVNYTTLGKRRIAHVVTASYDAPTETVRKACLEAVARTQKVLADPAAAVFVSNYGESSIEYTIHLWCDCNDYWDVYFAALENIRACFAEAGVEMTYNHLNVHIVEK